MDDEETLTESFVAPDEDTVFISINDN